MSERTEQLLDELVRLQVRTLRQEAESQADAIRTLDSLGFGSQRIAELLGASVGTVNKERSRTKKAKPNG